MERRGNNLAHRTCLDEAARVHHRGSVGELASDPQIVGHDDDRHTHLALELAQQEQDLDLYGRIERSCWLVRQQ